MFRSDAMSTDDVVVSLGFELDDETVSGLADIVRMVAAGSEELLYFLSDQLDGQLLDDCIELVEGVSSPTNRALHTLRPSLNHDKARLSLAERARKYVVNNDRLPLLDESAALDR